MFKKNLCLLLLFALNGFAQTITVDNTTNSPQQLVNLLLRNSCVQISNVSISSPQSVAYFNKNGSAFPINEGIIIRNGNALQTQGPYTGLLPSLSTQINTNTDAYLQGISNASGQNGNITDVAFLEFDFTPISNSFSFDFLFASNEYGQYQCSFSDVFAFELTNTLTNITTNLAVIPGTSTPITVKDIRNTLYNSSCLSENAIFFSTYNVNNPAASTLNMRGHTVVMNASSVVIPNTPYHIKLVIGDYANSNFDSAVFLAAGSFNTVLNLGPDLVICAGNTTSINSNLDNSYNFTWLLNGSPIIGQTSPNLNINAVGRYTLQATKGTCTLTDTVDVTNLAFSNPVNLQTCNTGAANYSFNLTQNNETTLGINNVIYDVFYYSSMANANANIAIATPNNYLISNNATVYIKLFNNLTNQFCNTVYPFNLIINNAVLAADNVVGNVCNSANGINFNLSSLNNQILNGNAPSSYTITFYNNATQATNSTNAIPANVNIPAGSGTQTYWVRMEDANNRLCFDITSVNVVVNPSPVVTELADVVVCSTYTLTAIANGNYFSGPNGTGTPYFAGNVISDSQIIYIFGGPDANGCTNQSDFLVYFIDEYTPPTIACGKYLVPEGPYSVGAFYTAPGGPTGTGTIILAGTQFVNNTQTPTFETIYYYATVNGVLCRDQSFLITINPIPLADNPVDVTFCNSYTLPTLTNGNYFTASGGGGTALFAGNVITSTQTIYVYADNGLCNVENPFNVNIIDPNIFTNVQGCGSYQLPPITFGGYFSAPNGGGVSIDPTVPITSSQVVYYFTNTTLLPNCTSNLNYNITIIPLPPVDVLPSGTFCGQFVLPILTNGFYYKLPGGSAAVGQVTYSAGQIIDLSGIRLDTGTYYINTNSNAFGCSNESSFTININPFPITDGVIDSFNCLPYTIPTPTNGLIYTQPGGPTGSGTLVSNTQIFNTTNTFYIYNINTVTNCSVSKPFTVNYVGINLPNYQDVKVCEAQNYTLPTLTHVAPSPENYTIGYFYSPNGVNPVPNGTVFNTPNTTTTIYVYAFNGDRYTCTQETSFTITVSQTPVLNSLGLIFATEACGNYVLPALPVVNFVANYYTASGGNAANLISNFNINTPGNYTYYLRASATNNPNCFDEKAFSFVVYPLRELTIIGGNVCVDPVTNTLLQPFTLNTNLNPAEYIVTWYLNNILLDTGTSYTALQSGIYEVRFNKIIPDVGNLCNYKTTTVEVIQSGPALANFTVSSEFNETSFITTNIIGGFGSYQFQLEYEDGTKTEFQTNNTFNNLSTGTYFVNIFDVLGGCSPTRVGPIYIVNYPNYFTPNNDGYNENWNIFDLKNQTNARVSVFDRYGKLLKQFNTNTIGWDGTFNGEKMPSTDYWFTVDYVSQATGLPTTFKAHFTLKR